MSDRQMEHDPIELLRSADPVDPDRLPPGSEARLRARVLEETMAGNESMVARERRFPRSFWPALSAAGAMALVVAVVAGAGLLNGGGVVPGASLPPSNGPVASAPAGGVTTTPEPTGGPITGGTAMCAFMYDLETLADREFAFDGTVTAIDGSEVTFTVSEWYRDDRGQQVTLTADGMTSESGLLGGPGLAIGGRYLVAGDETFAWSCGFTQYWNEATAADWARVLAD